MHTNLKSGIPLAARHVPSMLHGIMPLYILDLSETIESTKEKITSGNILKTKRECRAYLGRQRCHLEFRFICENNKFFGNAGLILT